MKLWCYFGADGRICADSDFQSAEDTWRTMLGWPTGVEISEAKALGDWVKQIEMPSPSDWRPIETAPRDAKCLFWVVPRTANETWKDTSGNPILAKSKPHAELCAYGGWGALMKATHWQPMQALPEGPK